VPSTVAWIAKSLPDPTSRYTRHDRVRRDILRHDSVGGYDGTPADRDAPHHDDAVSDPHVVLDHRARLRWTSRELDGNARHVGDMVITDDRDVRCQHAVTPDLDSWVELAAGAHERELAQAEVASDTGRVMYVGARGDPSHAFESLDKAVASVARQQVDPAGHRVASTGGPA
jgi:hypothetical protein